MLGYVDGWNRSRDDNERVYTSDEVNELQTQLKHALREGAWHKRECDELQAVLEVSVQTCV